MNEETKHPNTPNVVTEQDKGRCAPSPGSVRCYTCEHWEPDNAVGQGPARQVSITGYCPVFSKATAALHGSQCTAHSPNGKLSNGGGE